MRPTIMALVALILWSSSGATAALAAQGETLPELAPLTTVRESYVLTFNGRPLQVCEREWRSWNRLHGVCRDLATATAGGYVLVEGLVVEFVLFDGTRYERVNDQTSWTASPDADFAPDLSLNDGFFRFDEAAVLSRVGPAAVGSIATTQYQYWTTDDALNEQIGGQLTYDLFLSADGYVAKTQLSARGAIAGMGSGDLSETRVYSQFNAPVTIAPPANP